MVRFDSWRAASPGNRAGRNLVTKSTLGGRATRQAVTRVKLEQASKAAMWEPTQRSLGEGRADWEEPGAGARHVNNHYAPIRTTGVVSTACHARKVVRVSGGGPGWSRNRVPRTSSAGWRTIWA